MIDVTGVVLTLGEPTLDRALASLERQTLPVADVVLVRGVRPFHKALNLGASRVTTPYFFQLDSDMILDPECVELLAGAMSDEVGIAVGLLRDPLMGTIPGVKLFRRACFDRVQLQDSITQDVDFYYDLADLGWLTLYVARHVQGRAPHTFGEHRPRYSPSYTYSTYFQLGVRVRRRRNVTSLCWRIASLRRSRHEAATVARVALGHGFFCEVERDVPKRPPTRAELAFIRRLERARRRAAGAPSEALAARLLAEPAERVAAWGRGLVEAGDDAGLMDCLHALVRTDARSSWLAEASLCHGALSACEAAA